MQAWQIMLLKQSYLQTQCTISGQYCLSWEAAGPLDCLGWANSDKLAGSRKLRVLDASLRTEYTLIQ